MSNFEQKLAELEARLKVLEAERGILQTLYRYGHVVDYGPTEQRLDCFTEDGVFHLVPKGKVPRQYRPIDEPTGKAERLVVAPQG